MIPALLARIAAGTIARSAAPAAGRAISGASVSRAAGAAEGIAGVIRRPRVGYAEMMESLRSFNDRLDRGEPISDEEILNAPAGSLPPQLADRRSRIVVANMLKSADGQSAVVTAEPPLSQPTSESQSSLPGPAGPAGPQGPPGRSGSLGSSGGGDSESSGGFSASIADTLTQAASAGTKFGAAILSSVSVLEALNTGVMYVNQGLTEYNGQIAAAYSQFQADEAKRGIRKGETMQGPLSALIQEQSELRDSISSVTNEVSAGVTQILTWITRGVNYLNDAAQFSEIISSTLRDIRELFPDSESDTVMTPWQAFLADASDGKFDGKRPDFGGPKSIFKD